MTQITTGYKCQDCSRDLKEQEKPCPHCGSARRDININLFEQIKIKENFGFKKFSQGIKSFVVHLKQGWFPSQDTIKHPEGVQLTQLVDRENNFYQKKVVDEKTGKVTKDLEQPLDQHK